MIKFGTQLMVYNISSEDCHQRAGWRWNPLVRLCSHSMLHCELLPIILGFPTTMSNQTPTKLTLVSTCSAFKLDETKILSQISIYVSSLDTGALTELILSNVMSVAKMGNTVARARIKPTSLVFLTSVLMITTCRFPDVTNIPMPTCLCSTLP